MRRNVTAVIALVGMLVPAAALAQAASPGRDTQLQQEMRHRRVIVRPLTPTDQVQQDVDRAAAEIQQQEREQAMVRDLTRPAQRSPQMDPDLKGGIQSRNLNNVLRR
jgi:hypothetical protein